MMTKLTYQQAREILPRYCDERHLLLHALAVSAAMGAMADLLGGDCDHWRAIGYIHDVDYQQYPEEHLQHTEAILQAEGVDEEDIRAVLTHGFGLCSTVEPQTPLEKSLFTVDELTGIVMAAALMRPGGISDMEVKSVLKKFKDKRFAAGCQREVIMQGCDMLALPLADVAAAVIAGMKDEAEALGIAGAQVEA